MQVKSEGVVGFGDEEGDFSNGQQFQKKKKGNKKSGGFQSLGLCGPVLNGLQKRGYKLPTPIQRKSIPLILEGRDVVAMARTGSGKTACFLIPMFEKLMKSKPNKASGIRALILSPTRELALQTLRFIRELGKFTSLRSTAVLGGDSMEQQFGAVHGNPDIVVATPGRFLHLCVEMDLKLSTIEYVVFDEADRLFEMGFGEQLTETLSRLPDSRQTVLFSATLPKLLVNFARAGLSDPALIRLDVESKLPDTLNMTFLAVRTEDKQAALLALLQALPPKSQTLVFLATRHHVEYCHTVLDRAGVSNTFIYSDLDASARKINAAKFQNGNCSVLLVTDVAARGVDIPHLDYVVNYHFPAKAKLFVHRVGRCARAGRAGTAFSLVSAEETPFVLDLHLFLGRPMNLYTGAETTNLSCAFAKIPDELVEAEQARLIDWHETHAELASMTKVCANGFKKYLKSRPGASAESVRRVRDVDLSTLAAHPFFHLPDTVDTSASKELLDKMKAYKPRGTIFELNMSAKSKSYSVMKTTKKAHEKVIADYKQRQALKETESFDRGEPQVQGSGDEDEEGISSAFSTVIRGKKRKGESYAAGKKKKVKRDDENYIPHAAPDKHTEDGFSMNNFSSEANKVAFDLTGDTEEGYNDKKRLKKWDKVKKKMVGVPSERAGKIKTESGIWISKTYKTNRYSEWKEKSKIADAADSDDDEEEEQSKFKGKKKDFPNTHWGRHNRKVAAKEKSRAGLRKPEQILKSRKEMQKKRQLSLPKNKRGGGGWGGGGGKAGKGGKPKTKKKF